MSRLVFLLEEYSMKVFLDRLIPRLFPDLPFLCVPHEGKQDLQKSIPRKLRAWREPGVRFVVVHDNDSAECSSLKEELVGLCRKGSREDTLVRIAVQELEAWYIGDPAALAAAFSDPSLESIERRGQYRDPDAVVRPSAELTRLVPAFQKVSGARRMSTQLTREGNRSRSFSVFLRGIDTVFEKMQSTDYSNN